MKKLFSLLQDCLGTITSYIDVIQFSGKYINMIVKKTHSVLFLANNYLFDQAAFNFLIFLLLADTVDILFALFIWR